MAGAKSMHTPDAFCCKACIAQFTETRENGTSEVPPTVAYTSLAHLGPSMAIMEDLRLNACNNENRKKQNNCLRLGLTCCIQYQSDFEDFCLWKKQRRYFELTTSRAQFHGTATTEFCAYGTL